MTHGTRISPTTHLHEYYLQQVSTLLVSNRAIIIFPLKEEFPNKFLCGESNSSVLKSNHALTFFLDSQSFCLK